MVILAMGRVGVVEKARRVVRRGTRWKERIAGSMVNSRAMAGCIGRFKRAGAGQCLRWIDDGGSRWINNCWAGGRG